MIRKYLTFVVGNKLRVLIVLLLVLFELNLYLLYNSIFFSFGFFSFFSGESGADRRADTLSLLHPEFQRILRHEKYQFFLIEPHVLAERMRQNIGEEAYQEFRWRFQVPMQFEWNPRCLSVGLFAEDIQQTAQKMLYIRSISSDVQVVQGAPGPFNTDADNSSIHYLLIQFPDPTNASVKLRLQVVVFYRIQHFLWIGPMSTGFRFRLTNIDHHQPDQSFNLRHFGTPHEQIFDPFELTTRSAIRLPDDSRWFLSQLSTSTYIHCPEQRRIDWFRRERLKVNRNFTDASEAAIVNFKSFARSLEMQFWLMCGTLLGWLRQCQITPFTNDLDVGTWPAYLRGRDRTAEFQAEARKHRLKMSRKFGEPTATQEYSFWSTESDLQWVQIDLFFMYRNQSHLLITTHTPPNYWYTGYPVFRLCAAALLGHKVLVPCDPLAIVEAEYGQKWRKPDPNWNYFASSPNIRWMGEFKFNVTQRVLY